MSNYANNGVKKTRNRVPISCEPCRKKKMKCDKQKPCGGCIKNKTEDNCRYASIINENASRVQLFSEIIKLKMKVNKMEKILQANNIDINDYNDMALSVASDSSPDSLFKEEKDDPTVSLIEKFDKMVFKENRVLHSGTTSYATFFSADEELSSLFFRYMSKHEEQYKDYIKSQQVKPRSSFGQHNDLQKKHAYADPDYCLEVGLNGKSGSTLVASTSVDHKVVEQVNALLPPMFAINALIDNFFEYAYYLLPYVDESIFREEISYVLFTDKFDTPKIHIGHVQNTSIVSLLLIVLRFSYLTIDISGFYEDPSLIKNVNIAKVIKSNIVIDDNFTEVARNLILGLPGSESIFKKVTLRNVQVLMLLRLYQSHSPELNNESYECSLSLGLVIQMCRVLGSYRDPDFFPNVFKDFRVKNLWRRIYYKLIWLDTMNSFDFGSPLIISNEEFDIKLPTLTVRDNTILKRFRKGVSVNTTDKELKAIIKENAINRDIELTYKCSLLIREAVKLCHTTSTGNVTKKSEFMALISKVQAFMDNSVTGIYDLIDGSELPDNFKIDDPIEKIFNIPKLMKLEVKLNLLSLHVVLNYLLYMNEDAENTDEKLELAIKATESSMILFKINFDFTAFLNQNYTLHGHQKMYKSFRKFSNNCEKLIASRIQCNTQRALLWVFSLFLRSFSNEEVSYETTLSKFNNSTDSVVTLNWLNVNTADSTNDQLMLILFQYIQQFYHNCMKIKNEYFEMWRATMLIKIFINFFKNSKSEKFDEFVMNIEINNSYFSKPPLKDVNQHAKEEYPRMLSAGADSYSGLDTNNNGLTASPWSVPTFQGLIFDTEEELFTSLNQENQSREKPLNFSMFTVGTKSRDSQQEQQQLDTVMNSDASSLFSNTYVNTPSVRNGSQHGNSTPSARGLNTAGPSSASPSTGHSNPVTDMSCASTNDSMFKAGNAGLYSAFGQVGNLGNITDGSVSSKGALETPGRSHGFSDLYHDHFTPDEMSKELNLEAFLNQLSKDSNFQI